MIPNTGFDIDPILPYVYVKVNKEDNGETVFKGIAKNYAGIKA